MEYIVSFPKEQANHPSVPFGVEMAGITYPDREYHIYRKRSELFCMEYVISGQGTVSVDHQTFSVGSGDIYILPHNVSHDYRACADDPYEKIWFNIQGTIIPQLMTSYHLEGIYHISHAECLRQRFYEFLDICRRTDLETDDIFQKCALQFHTIVMELSNLIAATNKISSAESKIKEYIDRHVYDTIDPEDLLMIAPLSYSQIARRFKKKYNCSVFQYIQKCRIETAAQLLTNTSLSVKEIAYKLQFADEHYFSNVFKKYKGISPGQYRSL